MEVVLGGGEGTTPPEEQGSERKRLQGTTFCLVGMDGAFRGRANTRLPPEVGWSVQWRVRALVSVLTRRLRTAGEPDSLRAESALQNHSRRGR
ncbi:MAG: hypothetical protein ACPIOQ_05485 [Promethearchaeia archaeon]